MNQPHPGTPPFGQGGHPPPPPGQPPYQQGWPPPPAGQPPRGSGSRGSGTGRTLVWLAAGLVLVLVVIGVVALVVRGGDSADSDDKASGGALQASCEAYADVVLNSEIWAATDFDPDKLQEMYDAALAEITDVEIEELVSAEATVVVSYYRAVGEWKQAMMDALGRGETPETTLPAELTAQQGEVGRQQRAVIAACVDVLPQRDDDAPVPQVTAPTLERPSWMDED
ncbi:hypothetical protein RB608_27000 [Nocardioides sp. LHD-245]|uniref:hypothetical protein n=1 Tax=Nocardioides sp. LHD-245 TaxID=3051387 RepID=UPI0027DEFC73|nr:hypothetical protein [Nocardioides sp. LHD-245]